MKITIQQEKDGIINSISKELNEKEFSNKAIYRNACINLRMCFVKEFMEHFNYWSCLDDELKSKK